jgi:hypothetical protein
MFNVIEVNHMCTKKIKLSLTVEQACYVEDAISNRMVGLYDGATDGERAQLDKEYAALQTVWRSIVDAVNRTAKL